MRFFNRRTIDKLFHVVILLKSLFGFFEILAGIFIAVAGERLLDNFFIDMAMNEIAHDPDDLLAHYFINFSVDLYLGAKFFAVFYLIAHGVINIFLAVALIRNRLWAYPWGMAGFGAFIVYQLYKYFHTHSLSLLILTLFDILIVFLIWLEYGRQKRKKKLVQI